MLAGVILEPPGTVCLKQNLSMKVFNSGLSAPWKILHRNVSQILSSRSSLHKARDFQARFTFNSSLPVSFLYYSPSDREQLVYNPKHMWQACSSLPKYDFNKK
jgi:hypothetical protein